MTSLSSLNFFGSPAALAISNLALGPRLCDLIFRQGCLFSKVNMNTTLLYHKWLFIPMLFYLFGCIFCQTCFSFLFRYKKHFVRSGGLFSVKKINGTVFSLIGRMKPHKRILSFCLSECGVKERQGSHRLPEREKGRIRFNFYFAGLSAFRAAGCRFFIFKDLPLSFRHNDPFPFTLYQIFQIISQRRVPLITDASRTASPGQSSKMGFAASARTKRQKTAQNRVTGPLIDPG